MEAWISRGSSQEQGHWRVPFGVNPVGPRAGSPQAKQLPGGCAADNWIKAVLGKEKAVALHSSTLAWKIPWTEEPGRLQYIGSLRVGHD